SVLLGNGDGTFQAPLVDALGFLPPTGLEPYSVAVGDFNADGKLDVAIANFGDEVHAGTVGVLLGNGDGSFQPRVDYVTNSRKLDSEFSFPADSIVTADVNGDSKLDLVVSSEEGPVSVLLGNGDGTFQTGTVYFTGLGVPYSAGHGHSLVVTDV